MSTGAVIAIVVIALLVIGLLIALPKMRERGRLAKRERELQQRRQEVVSEHRSEAGLREQKAEQAEQRARSAEQEAQHERAEAQLHEERASLHEQGLADHELVEDDERERFAGTSAVRDDDAYADDQRGEGLGQQVADHRPADRTDATGSRPSRRA